MGILKSLATAYKTYKNEQEKDEQRRIDELSDSIMKSFNEFKANEDKKKRSQNQDE